MTSCSGFIPSWEKLQLSSWVYGFGPASRSNTQAFCVRTIDASSDSGDWGKVGERQGGGERERESEIGRESDREREVENWKDVERYIRREGARETGKRKGRRERENCTCVRSAALVLPRPCFHLRSCEQLVGLANPVPCKSNCNHPDLLQDPKAAAVATVHRATSLAPLSRHPLVSRSSWMPLASPCRVSN